MALQLNKPTVNGRVAIGEKNAERGFPVKLDYFIFTHEFDPKTNKAARHEAMMKIMTEKYGPKPKEIEVVLIHHHPEEVFFTSYMNYPGKECNCKGDGETAVRIMSDGTRKEGKCDYENCKFRIARTAKGDINTCKPTGILQFIIPEAPMSGGIWKFVTHSMMSIGKINSALMNLYSVRGTLFGLKVKMKIKTVQVKVNGQTQNVHTVEVEAPYSLDAIAEGAGTTIGTLLDHRTKHKTLGMAPDKSVVKELSITAEETVKEDHLATGVEQIIEAELAGETVPASEEDFTV